MHWLTLDWWKYLLAPPTKGTRKIKTAICRARGHPSGVEWYNIGGIEPNMRCKGCRDDLG